MKCPLCKNQPDSHSHLFFECPFSKSVWEFFKPMAKMETFSNRLTSVVYVQSSSYSNSIWSVIRRPVIGAVVYFVWRERNLRLFKKSSRSVENVIDLIKITVKLKMSGLYLKKSWQVYEAAAMWDFRLVYGDGSRSMK